MFATTPIRCMLAFMLLALLGFGLAAFSAADRPLGVLLGTVGAFLAACAVITEVEDDDQAPGREPWQVRR